MSVLSAAPSVSVSEIAGIVIGCVIVVSSPIGGGVVLATLFLLLGTIAFAGIGLLMAGTLRAEATLATANGVFLVLLFIGGMAYPLDKLPTVLEEIAKVLPAAALSESVRGALTPGVGVPGWSVVVLSLWAIGAPLVAARFFRWEE
jgi:ABC-2 type transport system permease protein